MSPLDRLEHASNELDLAEQGDLDAMERLLAERQQALDQFYTEWKQTGKPLSNREVLQLEAARAAGVRLRSRLRLFQADLREKWSRLHQASSLMRTLSPVTQPEQVDCRG